jgi:hypothetical protein
MWSLYKAMVGGRGLLARSFFKLQTIDALSVVASILSPESRDLPRINGEEAQR